MIMRTVKINHLNQGKKRKKHKTFFYSAENKLRPKKHFETRVGGSIKVGVFLLWFSPSWLCRLAKRDVALLVAYRVVTTRPHFLHLIFCVYSWLTFLP